MWFKKKYVFVPLFLAFAGVLVYFYYQVEQPPNENSITSEAKVRIKSEDLLASFMLDEKRANATYVEKIIEVQGVIKNVTFFNNRYTVILQGGGEYMCIMCDMKNDQITQVQGLSIGDSVVLKGVCKGFLMDAILLNCVLVSKTNE